MIENPVQAQITLQFALDSYKTLTSKRDSVLINPNLSNALEYLAKFRQQLGDAKDEDFNIFQMEETNLVNDSLDSHEDLCSSLEKSPKKD